MNGVEYLLGGESINNDPDRLFSDESCSFASEFSDLLLKSKMSREYADVATLAFWCRKGHIQQLKSGLPDISGRLGRGLCFHFSSPNVPTNFAYTWLISLLSGNANIVKLPEMPSPQTEFVLETICAAIKRFPGIEGKTAFVRYASREEPSAVFSANSDARMIWGGNDIIAQMKKLATKPRCVDIAFGDRYSICMIDGNAVRSASDPDIRRLAENFYNDTYLVDQNANSSPQLILWVNDREDSRKRFWDAVFRHASTKYELITSFAVDKYTQMCDDAIVSDDILSVTRRDSLVYRIELKSLRKGMERLRGIGGYFYEYSMNDVCEMNEIVTDEFQTITQFGIDEQALRRHIIESSLPGIDRIVPVGKAMNLNLIWDGYDLIGMLSRIIDIE